PRHEPLGPRRPAHRQSRGVAHVAWPGRRRATVGKWRLAVQDHLRSGASPGALSSARRAQTHLLPVLMSEARATFGLARSTRRDLLFGMQLQDLAETRSALIDLARRRFGRIPPERIADHVVAVGDGADWPVHKAAVEALARRWAFAERDGL